MTRRQVPSLKVPLEGIKSFYPSPPKALVFLLILSFTSITHGSLSKIVHLWDESYEDRDN